MSSIIELNNVSVIKNGKTILDDITWNVKNNENWAVIGKNGAGKSFLLRLLSANLYPSCGSIRILGRKFGETNLLELKKVIGFVSPNFQKDYDNETRVINVIYSGFFASNGLFYDVTDYMKEETLKIISFLNISNLKDRYYGELSNGEQKKVLIARALVSNPKILIFDEVCSGLDISSREEILKTVELLVEKGHNIIFVTHHIEEIIPAINKILLIKEGKIFRTGCKEELLNKNHLNEVLDINLDVIIHNSRYFLKYY